MKRCPTEPPAIDALQRACAARADVIGLAGGLPDPALFPRAAMHAAMDAVVRARGLGAFQYGWPEGDGRLREWLARRLSSPGRPLGAEDVVVTAGAQQAIALAVDALAPARVGVGAATYPALLALLRARGVPATDGPRASVFYAMPEIGNPEGLPMDRGFARALGRAPAIADGAYAELRFDGASARAELARPWTVFTFAKTLCPGLRIGCLVPPRERRAQVLRLKHVADLQASGLGQCMLAELLARLDYDEHLARLRAVYARRAEALADSLRRHLPSWSFREPAGGFSIFVDTHEPGDDVALLAAASAQGVSFDPGRLFRVRPHETLELRLCFSNASERRIDQGVARLARAWTAFTSRARAADARRRCRARRTTRPPSARSS